MQYRAACCNCGRKIVMADYVSREDAEDAMDFDGWYRHESDWYCPTCAVAARSAAELPISAKATG